MSLSFFDYLNSINDTKTDIMVDDVSEKAYNAFMINRGLSYFADTALFGNEMNQRAHMDKRLQYDFLKATIRKKKRFSKWIKPEESENLELVKKYYKCSTAKAKSALAILSDENLRVIKAKLSQGGYK